MSERCVAFIVEDDEDLADGLKTLVESLGHSWVHARTLVEAEAILAKGGFCYVLLDMQIPPRDGKEPAVGCGETILGLLRTLDSSRNAAGKHWLQIIVITGYSRQPEFVSRMYEMECDGFIAKPFGEDHGVVRDRIRGALALAGRSEHAKCTVVAAGSPRTAREDAPVAPAVREVRVAIDGTAAKGGRSHIEVNGTQRDMPDKRFLSVVLAVLARDRSSGGWSSRDELEIGPSRSATTQIREAFQGLVPEDFEVLEGDRRGNFRLNPQILVERIELDRLLEHPNPGVVRVVREHRKRRGHR